MHEHRVIERMIALLGEELQVMPSEGRADPAFLEAATDFLRTYADRCHHGKEEDILFRLLAEKDLDPELADDMAGLIEDHTFARTVTGRLIDANERYAAGDLSALGEIQDHIAALVGLSVHREGPALPKPNVDTSPTKRGAGARRLRRVRPRADPEIQAVVATWRARS
jgi:hemerythrin-like domain-containing protein